VKREDIDKFFDNLAKYLLDVSKLIFASLMLGGIVRLNIPLHLLITAGGVISLLVAVGGLFIFLFRRK
jgi:hypothetical protein